MVIHSICFLNEYAFNKALVMFLLMFFFPLIISRTCGVLKSSSVLLSILIFVWLFSGLFKNTLHLELITCKNSLTLQGTERSA